MSKIKLFNELEKACISKNINLGLTLEKLPDKKWLINVLNTLNEGNEVFQQYYDNERVIGITRDDLALLKQFETSLGRKSPLNFLKELINNRRKKNENSETKIQQYKAETIAKKGRI